jgi:uncharacterized protein YukE
MAWLPEIPGDPAGMRVLAGLLRNIAADVGSQSSDLRGDVTSMTFEGPAGDAFRERMQSVTERARATADQLLDLAGLLEHSATEVEAAQRERAERLAQMEAEERAAAERAAAVT